MIGLTQKIKIAMVIKGLEVNDLAKEIGVSREYLSPIINEKRVGNRPDEILEQVKSILNLNDLVVHYKEKN